MNTNWIQKNILGIIGIVIGAIAGFAYWRFIGCNSGTCMITSKPLNSTLYGSLMGYLLFSIFKKEQKIQKH
jgi:LytS/YehU family sensor histidine kinase